MSQTYLYYYARIDEDNMCVEVIDTSVDHSGYPEYIPIPEFNEEYIMKYYNAENGKWYLEPAFATEWIPE